MRPVTQEWNHFTAKEVHSIRVGAFGVKVKEKQTESTRGSNAS